MIDAIRKAVMTGVGAAAMTTEKAEQVLNELVSKGKLSATDAREAARKLADEGKTEFDEASKTLESKFDEVMRKLGRGQSERIDALETKIALLETRIAAMESAKVETTEQ